jgi:hypothetical protein
VRLTNADKIIRVAFSLIQQMKNKRKFLETAKRANVYDECSKSLR